MGLFPSIKTWKKLTKNLLKRLHPSKFIEIAKTRQAKSVYKKTRIRYKAKNRFKRQYRLKKQPVQAPPLVFIDELFWAHPNEWRQLGGPEKGKVETGNSNGLSGIDAEAEEFINRFREELANQEIVAHLL